MIHIFIYTSVMFRRTSYLFDNFNVDACVIAVTSRNKIEKDNLNLMLDSSQSKIGLNVEVTEVIISLMNNLFSTAFCRENDLSGNFSKTKSFR